MCGKPCSWLSLAPAALSAALSTPYPLIKTEEASWGQEHQQGWSPKTRAVWGGKGTQSHRDLLPCSLTQGAGFVHTSGSTVMLQWICHSQVPPTCVKFLLLSRVTVQFLPHHAAAFVALTTKSLVGQLLSFNNRRSQNIWGLVHNTVIFYTTSSQHVWWDA